MRPSSSGSQPIGNRRADDQILLATEPRQQQGPCRIHQHERCHPVARRQCVERFSAVLCSSISSMFAPETLHGWPRMIRR